VPDLGRDFTNADGTIKGCLFTTPDNNVQYAVYAEKLKPIHKSLRHEPGRLMPSQNCNSSRNHETHDPHHRSAAAHIVGCIAGRRFASAIWQAEHRR